MFCFHTSCPPCTAEIGEQGCDSLVPPGLSTRHPGIAHASCSSQVQHRAAPSPGHPKVSQLPPSQQGTLHGAVLCCRDLVAQGALPLVHGPFAMLILSSTCSIRAPVWQVFPLFISRGRMSCVCFPSVCKFNLCSPWHVPLFLPLLIPD